VSKSFAAIDLLALRAALGAFATGVTIVTTRDSLGQDVGVTANSFNSVSLEPPMVLWSLSRKALSLPAFQSNSHFAVHVLAAEQDGLSRRFAKQGKDKFEQLAVTRGLGDVPLIDGCAARFQCHTSFNYDGGDHVIFVGEVLAFESFDRPPLLFHAGRYALAVEKHIEPSGTFRAPTEAASGEEHEFLFGLLGRAHNQLYHLIRFELGKLTLSDSEMTELGLLRSDTEASDAKTGRHLVDAVRAAEGTLGQHVTESEMRLLKKLLRLLLGRS
jgi:3-hydroxy-9,10-secoandrosta-1,3,5(10)-triene-9,17-dione monooxygenase reductase component